MFRIMNFSYDDRLTHISYLFHNFSISFQHYNAEHADLNDATYGVYQCDLCDKRFPTKTMYNQHR